MVKGISIVENAIDAIIATDENNLILEWNPAAEKLFGWSGTDVAGKNIAEIIIPPESRNEYEKGIKSFHNRGESEIVNNRFEKTVIHKQGNEFPAELYIRAAESGPNKRFIVFARDITQRIAREEKIRNSFETQRVFNSILKLSLDQMPLEDQLAHALDTILSISTIDLLPTGCLLLVEEEADVLKLKVHKGFLKDQLLTCNRVPFGKCHCGRAAITRRIQFVECIDQRHDFRFDNMEPHGHYCVPILSGNNILGVLALYLTEGHQRKPDEEDFLMSVANILAGIIERKRMEEQRSSLIESLKSIITDLMDEKKFTESIVQSLSGGLMVLDLDGRIITSNPTGKNILGQFAYSFAVDGRKLSEIIGISAANAMTEIKKPVPDELEEITLQSIRGEERILGFSVAPREDSAGRTVGIIVSFNDITEMKYFKQEMERVNRLGTVAEIASAVAHEVRNPLAGIKTMSQSIEENLDDTDDNKEYIRRIIKQVDRLNQLLNEFFTYAKPGKPRKVKTSLVDIINETKPLIKSKLSKRNIQLKEDYEKNLPRIFVDPNQLQQVFLNLLLNAIDAVSSDGIIEIMARELGSEQKEFLTLSYPGLNKNTKYVAVYFSDNGPGMPPEIMENAFEPFFTTKHSGSGLGLSIVYRILKENNAIIYIDCSGQTGTTFIMFFEVQ